MGGRERLREKRSMICLSWDGCVPVCELGSAYRLVPSQVELNGGHLCGEHQTNSPPLRSPTHPPTQATSDIARLDHINSALDVFSAKGFQRGRRQGMYSASALNFIEGERSEVLGMGGRAIGSSWDGRPRRRHLLFSNDDAGIQ